MCICMCVYKWACIMCMNNVCQYLYEGTYLHMFECICVYMCVYKYVCIYVDMYTCLCICMHENSMCARQICKWICRFMCINICFYYVYLYV